MKSLEAKLAVLNLSWSSSERALEEKDVKECRNQLNLSEKKFAEIRELITNIQEGKVIAGEDLALVETWGVDTRESLHEYVRKYEQLSNFVDEEREREQSEKVREGLERVERERESMERERENMTHDYELNLINPAGRNVRAKLPKIQVSKFG